MDWRTMCGDKLVSAEEAVRVVKSGHAVAVSPQAPLLLCKALFERHDELSGVRIDQPGSTFPWADPIANGAFTLHEMYLNPMHRENVWQGSVEWVPMAHWRTDEMPRGWAQAPDVFMGTVSPPDEEGFCSFGQLVTWSPTFARHSKVTIAEVREDALRTFGDNRIHISQITHLVEDPNPSAMPDMAAMLAAMRTEDDVANTEVICSLVASELIRDGDTIQIGVGTVSAAQAMYLGDKHDLGVHTEYVVGGMVDLVKSGVINGSKKARHPGKVVGTGCVLLTKDELDFVGNNPTFELYDWCYVEDLRHLVEYDNLVSINNALMVDLTGQVNAESIGGRIWSGPGGQSIFTIAASYAAHGRSIIVTPSSHLIDGQRVSRIVATLDPGTSVTDLRTFVDYVVTEQGIAKLRGKSYRQRMDELLSVAHPDLRGELRAQARAAYNL